MNRVEATRPTNPGRRRRSICWVVGLVLLLPSCAGELETRLRDGEADGAEDTSAGDGALADDVGSDSGDLDGTLGDVPEGDVADATSLEDADALHADADALRDDADALHEDADALHEDADALHADADALHEDADALHADADALHADADALGYDADALHADADALRDDADIHGLDADGRDADADADATDADAGTRVVPGTLTLIPAGSFTMGSPPDELGRDEDEVEHEVTLTRSFWIQTTEVTQGLWQSLMGNNPSYFSDTGVGATCGDRCPVEWVNWWEALAFANALSEEQGLPPCFRLRDCEALEPGEGMDCLVVDVASWSGSVYDCEGYRLPTEAEWEYAARAGTTAATYNGNLTSPGCADNTIRDIAWFCGNAAETQPVGEKTPNAFGLYDILGNVWEWTWDRYDAYSGAATDPAGTPSEPFPVFRGGDYNSGANGSRSAFRWWAGPGHLAPTLGFRLVRSLPPSESSATERFARIPAGTFTMGAPAEELGRGADEVEHTVTLSHDYWIQTAPVTQGEWETLVGNNPARFSASGTGAECGPDCPVEQVTWFDALAYANLLSNSHDLPACYVLTGCSQSPGTGLVCTDVALTAASGSVYDCEGFRLPTEAEWEYAARGGTVGATYAGELTAGGCADTTLDSIAWFCGNTARITHPVRQKLPNAFGLYDMLGNVLEWNWDWYGTYPGTTSDPEGPETGTARVLRGGSMGHEARFLRSAQRDSTDPSRVFDIVGFRLVRTVPE